MYILWIPAAEKVIYCARLYSDFLCPGQILLQMDAGQVWGAKRREVVTPKQTKFAKVGVVI